MRGRTGSLLFLQYWYQCLSPFTAAEEMFPLGEMGLVLVSALLISGFTVSVADAGLKGKALVFPYVTDYSYVKLTPQKSLELKEFTLCMKVATELSCKREVILFAYRTADFDELNVWRDWNGLHSLHMKGEEVTFDIPPLNTFKTQVCITWDSSSGLSAFWVNGKRSVRKVFRKARTIQTNGTAIIGQDPDRHMGDFDAAQSFVGEIADVKMWDYVLPETQIKALHLLDECHVPKGNIFDWDTIEYQIHGKVYITSAV